MNRRFAILATLAATFLAAAFAPLVPHVPLAARTTYSTEVRDRHGALLRLTLARDDRYRVHVPLADVPRELVDAVLLQEDRWFRHHGGVNPASLVRGAWTTYVARGRRVGGSTITMQLARLLWRLDTRSPAGKLVQVARAVELELFHSKDEILEAYLNVAPYGGNVEGVGAASLIHFGKPVAQLTLPEALTLAVIPQDPSGRGPSSRDDRDFRRSYDARARLYATWRTQHAVSDADDALMTLPLTRRGALPFAAPHFVDARLAERRVQATPDTTIATTIDVALQARIERRVETYLAKTRRRGIANAAVLLVDTRDMAVRAAVGSAGYHDAAIAGQVDGTRAKRSPGSTLKPFIYALAVDQGLIHPQTVLRDVPTSFGPFSPENHDGRFVGPITATDALVRSRNIPAVAVAAQLTQPSFYEFLRRAGISKLASEKHYGLALVLGGGEVTMEELARLYAMLSNDGVMRPLRHTEDAPRDAGVALLSPEASFVVRDMLRQNQLPSHSAAMTKRHVPVAWKTGTSWGFRDAWTAGIVGPYVLVVWMGDFEGAGNPALLGIEAAAPLFFDVVDALAADGVDFAEPSRRWPLNLARVEICRASGDLPNTWCPQRGDTWFIPGKSPIRVSTIHRPVAIDVASGLPACHAYDPSRVRIEVHEFWPTELARVFAQAGLPRRAPPVNPACPGAGATAGTPPRIASPLRATTYALRVGRDGTESIALSAHAEGDVREIYWFVDDAFAARSAPGAEIPWTPRRAGRYRVRAVDDHGRATLRDVEVTLVM